MAHANKFQLDVHVADSEYDFKIYFDAGTARIWQDEPSGMWLLEKNGDPDDRLVFAYITSLELNPHHE